MPKLQPLHCDRPGVANWQYAKLKIRYWDSIQMIAPATEGRILREHGVYDWRKCYDQRGREERF